MSPARFLFAIAAVVTPALALAQNEKLQHDPFARPDLARLQNAGRPTPKSAAPGSAAPKSAAPKPSASGAAGQSGRALNLQAVMVAGPGSIANVDGTMLRIGEQIYGYRLVAVHERSAVFQKDKAQFTVSIRSQSKPTPAASPQPQKRGEAR